MRCINRLSLPALAVLAAHVTVPTVVHAQATHTASSPDGRNVVSVDTKDGTLRYAVSRDGKPIVLPSLLGFTIRTAPPLRDGLRITAESRSSFDETWTQRGASSPRFATTTPSCA